MNASATRRQIVIRSDQLGAEDFGEMFARVFGNLYSGMPKLERKVSISGVYGRYEGVSFRRMNYGCDFTVEMPQTDDEITFVIPTAGKIVFNLATETVGIPQVGIAVEKSAVRSVSFVDSHEQYGMSIRRSLFAERLSVLLGKPIIQKVRFQPFVDLKLSAFDGIKSVISFATGNELDLLMNSSALMPARLQEMLVDSLLEVWPHNYSDALRRPAPSIAPRHVKLAMDYIQQHPDALVSGTELAELSNVSLRALQDGFKRFVGISIVAYQRQVRLERAHQLLLHEPLHSVADVALRLGFSNVGRFSQYFQHAFGVSPLALKKGLHTRRH